MQAVRLHDPLSVLLKSPAPNGLGIFVRAAQSAGARADAVARAEDAIVAFEQLLARFPQGRAGLEAAISGWMPETREQACQALGLDPSRRYLLTICRLMVWKGVDGILRALAELPSDVHLLVAGDGDMEEPWRALAAELGLGERARFLGNVPHARIPLYVRAATVFVLNSRYEGLSHTLIEVQRLGTPIVASGVCGNPEVVEDGVSGRLVDPGDPRALRAALAELLEDAPLRERLARGGLAHSARFERETTFAEVEAALMGAARGRPPSAAPAGSTGPSGGILPSP